MNTTVTTPWTERVQWVTHGVVIDHAPFDLLFFSLIQDAVLHQKFDYRVSIVIRDPRRLMSRATRVIISHSVTSRLHERSSPPFPANATSYKLFILQVHYSSQQM